MTQTKVIAKKNVCDGMMVQYNYCE